MPPNKPPSRQPKRPHYLQEWMDTRGLTKADLARATGAAPSQITRWVRDGASPSQEWADKLRAYFKAGREGIFRHPDEAWLQKFFDGRQREEIERIKATL